MIKSLLREFAKPHTKQGQHAPGVRHLALLLTTFKRNRDPSLSSSKSGLILTHSFASIRSLFTNTPFFELESTMTTYCMPSVVSTFNFACFMLTLDSW